MIIRQKCKSWPPIKSQMLKINHADPLDMNQNDGALWFAFVLSPHTCSQSQFFVRLWKMLKSYWTAGAFVSVVLLVLFWELVAGLQLQLACQMTTTLGCGYPHSGTCFAMVSCAVDNSRQQLLGFASSSRERSSLGHFGPESHESIKPPPSLQSLVDRHAAMILLLTSKEYRAPSLQMTSWGIGDTPANKGCCSYL